MKQEQYTALWRPLVAEWVQEAYFLWTEPQILIEAKHISLLIFALHKLRSKKQQWESSVCAAQVNSHSIVRLNESVLMDSVGDQHCT